MADQFTNVPSTSTQAPVAVVNPQTLTPAIRAEMVSKFSAESGMYPDWAERCLDQNNFDYNKSAQVFMDLKVCNYKPH